jgi:hypothetical protein
MRLLVSTACLVLITACVSEPTSQDVSTAVHMQAYLRYFAEHHDPFEGNILFVDESESVVGELRERIGSARFEASRFCTFDKQLGQPVDVRTRKPGVQFRFDRMEIRGDTASLIFSWFASPIGAQNYEVELRLVGGSWTITKWEIGLTS